MEMAEEQNITRVKSKRLKDIEMIVTIEMPAYKFQKSKTCLTSSGRKGTYKDIAEVFSYPQEAHLFTKLSLAIDTDNA